MQHGRIRRALVVALAATSIGAAAPASVTAGDRSGGQTAVAAKSCSRGFTKATINGAEKCLRRGQFCARAADRQYRRYGFRCTRFDSGVNRYRLT